MPPDLELIEALARRAGAILRLAYGKKMKVQHKGVIDLVTEADHRSEAYLIGEIRRRYPQHRILTEESGLHAGDGSGQWLIDPLDGTVNFAHGVPFFCVSVAYLEEGQIRLGVVYEPLRDECFSAVRGQGAFLNGQAITCASTTDLNESLLTTGFPYDVRSRPDNNLNWYAYFALHSQGVRRLGSAALDLCYVAAGRFDGYWELSVQPWDIAAGALIAREAGAQVTNVHGEEELLTPPCSILAAPPAIHAAILGIFRAAEQPSSERP